MQKYTGTRAQFEKLAPKGLILHSEYYHAYLYYRNGKFRFLDDENTPSLTRVSHKEEVLQGGWNAFLLTVFIFIDTLLHTFIKDQHVRILH